MVDGWLRHPLNIDDPLRRGRFLHSLRSVEMTVLRDDVPIVKVDTGDCPRCMARWNTECSDKISVYIDKSCGSVDPQLCF